MSHRNYVWIVPMAAFLCTVLCGKKMPDTPAIIFNTDTLSTGQVAELDPSIGSDSIRLRAVALRLVCAGDQPDSSTDPLSERFAERLSLLTNAEWKPEAASLLLNAAKRLVALVDETASCGTMRGASDSLLQLSSKVIRVAGASAGWRSFACDSIDLAEPEGRTWVVHTMLTVTPEIADLLMEFIGTSQSNSSGADSTDVKKLVEGLVSSTSPERKSGAPQKMVSTTHGPRPATYAGQSDNSTEALRYRGQNSIRDSIEKHIPNLKQLYKKNLKTNSSLSGKLIVTIRVDAAGEVIGVRVKASEIDSKAFLESFTTYIRLIRFAPIPETVGAMTFDFPFEFYPEM